MLIKFIYCEKATKFCKISTVDLTSITLDISMVEISQNFVAFSQYMNFTVNAYYINLNNVCPVKIRSKHSSNTLLRLLRIFTGQTLDVLAFCKKYSI